MQILSRLLNTIRLSFRLFKDDFKERNGNNRFGIIWYLLDPIMLFITFIFLFEIIFKIHEEVYPGYLLIGLVIFNFFRFSTMQSFHILRKNRKKIDSEFTPGVFVLSNLFHSIFSHLFEIILLFIAFIYYGFPLIGLIFYPLIFLFFSLFILGLTSVLSVIGVFFNELSRGWGILVRTLWFITPTFYFVEKIGMMFFLNLFNPIFYFLYISREIIIYNRIPELWMILVMIYGSLFVFLFGILIFQKNKGKIIEKLM